MKKVIGIILILLSIACFGFAAYNYINIEMITSEKNNVLYDGFNEPYINGKPNSSHTIFVYCSIAGGIVLGSSGIGLIKKTE